MAVGLAATLAGCASAPRTGARPSPFPSAPGQPWAAAPAPEHVLGVHALLQTATGLLGTRYRLGGTTPESGFDCSGFVRYVFGQYLVNVPRTAAEQFLAGEKIVESGMASGDLVFFSTTGPGVTHVGIVVDPEAHTFVHAPGTGAVVRIERFDTNYWRTRSLGFRRVPLRQPPS